MGYTKIYAAFSTLLDFPCVEVTQKRSTNVQNPKEL